MLEHSSYLIQRFVRPAEEATKEMFAKLDRNLLPDGKYNESMREVLRHIVKLDYMGSAEFEFGSVPESIKAMLKNRSNLGVDTVTITYDAKSWAPEEVAQRSGKRTLYIIGDKSDLPEIKQRIIDLAGDKIQCKEVTYISKSCAELGYGAAVRGWQDIDNHFMFFKSMKMFNEFRRFFGL